MSVSIDTSAIEGIKTAIRNTNNNLTGPYGCGKSMENVLKTLNNHWKSTRARSFANGVCDAINPLITQINSSLTSWTKTVVDNGNQWLSNQESSVTISYGVDVVPYMVPSADGLVDLGINGVGNPLIPETAEGNMIIQSINGVFAALTQGLNELKNATAQNPDAFKGAGQDELGTTLDTLTTKIKKNLEKFNTDFETVIKSLTSETEQNAQISRQNMLGD